MTIIFAVVFLAVPLLVWRYFRARRLAYIVIALWLGPALYMLAFNVALAGCANVPYTALDGYLDCPTGAHRAFYAVFGPLASVFIVLMLSQGLAIFAWYLLPPALGLALELILRRTTRR